VAPTCLENFNARGVRPLFESINIFSQFYFVSRNTNFSAYRQPWVMNCFNDYGYLRRLNQTLALQILQVSTVKK
jgi:hypothetical protein